jgi:hypothetical protein
MWRRCHDPQATKYPAYGAKGLRVDEAAWVLFEAFLEDLRRKPSPAAPLDRI